MFSGKVVIVTGSSSGIGAGTAIHFAKLGADVTITGRNVDKLNKVAKQCEEVSKKQPLVMVGDLGNEEFIKTLLDATITHYKKLDVLVNNAGVGGFAGIQSCTIEQYERTMRVNLRAVFYLTMLAVPYLIETKGTVVNVSSVASLRAIPQGLVYCMSKAGLDQFTRCVALELASKQVRVNCVNPGPVYSDICQNSGMTDAQTDQVYKQWEVNSPFKSIGTPEEVATTIAFLAGEKSSFITGVTLPVDAGYQLVCIGVEYRKTLTSNVQQ